MMTGMVGGGGGSVPRPRANVTPENLHAFGNTTQPRGARTGDFSVTTGDSIVGRNSGNLPQGQSLTNNPQATGLTGHYHTLPSGTPLPDGIGIIADGRNVIPGSPRAPGHYTMFPTREMTLNEFNGLFHSLPWQYGGRIR
jgi:hypothetical protein